MNADHGSTHTAPPGPNVDENGKDWGEPVYYEVTFGHSVSDLPPAESLVVLAHDFSTCSFRRVIDNRMRTVLHNNDFLRAVTKIRNLSTELAPGWVAPSTGVDTGAAVAEFAVHVRTDVSSEVAEGHADDLIEALAPWHAAPGATAGRLSVQLSMDATDVGEAAVSGIRVVRERVGHVTGSPVAVVAVQAVGAAEFAAGPGTG